MGWDEWDSDDSLDGSSDDESSSDESSDESSLDERPAKRRRIGDDQPTLSSAPTFVPPTLSDAPKLSRAVSSSDGLPSLTTHSRGTKRTRGDEPIPPPPDYTRFADQTYYRAQQLKGGVQPDAYLSLDAPFRGTSNETVEYYSAGYHEAFVTTDTFKLLRAAADNRDGTHTLPSAPKNPYFSKYKNLNPALQGRRGITVHSSTRAILLKFADGFRTSTALSFLTGPDGKPAAHVGMDLTTEGQASAHHLLRASVMEMLELDPWTTGMTEDAIVGAMASVVVASIAPGALAGRIEDVAEAKMGPRQLASHEERRQEMKARLWDYVSRLSPDERGFVAARVQSYLNRAQAGLAANDPDYRRLGVAPTLGSGSSQLSDSDSDDPWEFLPHTPHRSLASSGQGRPGGGGYLDPQPTVAPSSRAATLADVGHHVTQPGREGRPQPTLAARRAVRATPTSSSVPSLSPEPSSEDEMDFEKSA